MKTLLAIAAATSLLVGCATSSVHHAEQWEYKVSRPLIDKPDATMQEIGSRKTKEAFLNDLAKDGWIFIQKEENHYYFKRLKR